MRQNASVDTERKAMMAVLARAPSAALKVLWDDSGFHTKAEMVRGPETGLVTIRGRIGGGGSPFNVGEATVTRATVRIASGAIGHAYALGRDKEKARISATIDALWQDADLRPTLSQNIVDPLAKSIKESDETVQAETAATRVDFFTMVRGED